METKILLKMTIEGVKILQEMNKETKEMTAIGTQLQVSEMFENKQGDQDIRIHTLKVNKVLSKEEIDKVINKSIITNEEMGLKEFIFDYNKGYSCDTFEVLETKTKDIFVVNNSISGTIRTITSKTFEDKKTKETKISTTFSILSKEDNSIKLTSIKVNSEIKDYNKLVGKDLLFDNLNINIFNNKKYISTDILPTLLK